MLEFHVIAPNVPTRCQALNLRMSKDITRNLPVLLALSALHAGLTGASCGRALPYGFTFKQLAVYTHGFAISPRVCARVLPEFPVPLYQRRRECRALDAPAASCVMR